MDCVDRAIYDFNTDKYDNLPEATRRAFVDIFDPSSEKAVLVMKYLLDVLHYNQIITTSDPIFNSQDLALKNVASAIKKQLNAKEIKLGDTDE